MPNGEETKTLLYWNDMLMMKIIEFVERFKDRNSLELSSRRLRELCLKTPISGNFAIRLEEDPNVRLLIIILNLYYNYVLFQWPSILTLLMRPRNFSSRLSVRNCSDVPEDERSEIVGYNYKDTIQNPGNYCKNDNFQEFIIKFKMFSSTESASDFSIG